MIFICETFNKNRYLKMILNIEKITFLFVLMIFVTVNTISVDRQQTINSNLKTNGRAPIEISTNNRNENKCDSTSNDSKQKILQSNLDNVSNQENKTEKLILQRDRIVFPDDDEKDDEHDASKITVDLSNRILIDAPEICPKDTEMLDGKCRNVHSIIDLSEL